MRTLLFRHAEKENVVALDPALSAKGHKQAAKISEMIGKEALPTPTRLISSPKLRARQTLEKISRDLALEIQILPELNERQAAETEEQFGRRVKQCLLKIEAMTGVAFCVTHLDWIEEALIKIQSDTDLLEAQFQYWPPAQSMEFEIHDGMWSLRKFRSIEI